jgi:excisionase family DNA binding protein
MKSVVTGPLSVRPKDAVKLLSVGKTKLAELIANGSLESYTVGTRSRLITVKSIHRLLGLETDKPAT